MSNNIPGMLGAAGMYDQTIATNANDPTAPAAVGNMFRFLANGMAGAPDPNEMRAEMEKVRLIQNVVVTGMSSEVYDLSLESDRKRYCVDKVRVCELVRQKKASFNAAERKFAPRDGKWLAYLEWYEYTLEVKDVQMQPKEEAANG